MGSSLSTFSLLQSSAECWGNCCPYKGVLTAQQDEALVPDAADCRSSGSAEQKQEDLVLPFPQAAQELQAQLSTASFPTPHPGIGEQSQHSASPPRDLHQAPGTEPWGRSRLESPSTQQAQGNRLQGGLEVAKALFLYPSGAPQLRGGGKDTAGSSVMLPFRAELPGWEPKGPAQLVPVPPARGSTGRSLAEPARSCLLQQPPTRSTAELCVPTAQQGRQHGERGDRWPFPHVRWCRQAPGGEQGLCQQHTQQGASEHGLGSP